jgi:hypothetical protein
LGDDQYRSCFFDRFPCLAMTERDSVTEKYYLGEGVLTTRVVDATFLKYKIAAILGDDQYRPC